MKTRVAKCGHLVPVHPGRQRRLCNHCREARDKPALREWYIACRGCGVEAIVYHQSQCYCTEACRDATLRVERWALIEKRRANAFCLVCKTPLAGRRATKFCSTHCRDVAYGQRLAEPLPPRRCALPDCEAEFQPKKASQRCCSEPHGKKLWNRENPEPWNDRKRDHYHRRKALKKGSSTGRPVRLAEIRERDGNRCYLCERKVPDRVYPHPLSPSLDHVVPLSRGGAHDPDNVRLTHLHCNVEKGAGGGYEQLLLIG